MSFDETAARLGKARQIDEPAQGLLRHWRWLRHKIKHIIGGIVNQHPYLWYAAWGLMPKFNFLLPHEKA
jgi:hypothetical protein